ncbi:MAG: acyl-CoA dehydrogenase C-terminal domain-containing protein [Pseudomonadota bacterium]
MNTYKAPLRDITFALNEVLDYESHLQALPGCEEIDSETVEAIALEYAKFCEGVLSPLYSVGDSEGCSWDGGKVSTPLGFKDAYAQYCAGGWPSLSCEPKLGGQGLPTSLAMILGEMPGSANISFTLYTGGLSGAIETLAAFGTPQQREMFEAKLISGTWNATMCLTEPHCGTDLGLLKTQAEPDTNGTFRVSGTKIFITGGEHDLTENIVHLVLARLPDAPPGTKGISLFIVPKLMPNAGSDELSENGVSCGSIETKMGIKGSATCVMHFDNARGYLLGERNRGLSTMFKFINASRVRAAFQGVSHAELGFQKSLAYARDRLQMRSLSGAKNPAGVADPIIVHPDVRRMLLTQKVLTEGSRTLLYELTKHLDIVERSPDDNKVRISSDRLELLTPIAKGFVTEAGCEASNLALQCFGGHGYIKEWGVEQNVRDARISTLYEGTTGIQALDLVSRKILGSKGRLLTDFIQETRSFCENSREPVEGESLNEALTAKLSEWESLGREVGERASTNPEEIGAASYDFLMYSGYVSLAYFWLRSALVARERLDQHSGDQEFYEAKLQSAVFYFARILPRTESHRSAVRSGADSLMDMRSADFAF